MKKIFSVILAVIMLMGIGSTASFAVYETEEVPEGLIEELVSEGFKPSEEDENIWVFETFELDEYGNYGYAQGWFNVAENYGVAWGFTLENNVVTDSTSWIARWDSETETIEAEIGYDFTR